MNDQILQDAIATLPAEIFRAYDIRGIFGQTLNIQWAELIGRAIGSEARARHQQKLCVGYDGRFSSIALCDALIRGLQYTGIDVINIGLAPTPALYYATYATGTGSGVMVTGSHNPTDYNGFKIMLDKHTLSGSEMMDLFKRIKNQDLFSSDSIGEVLHQDLQEQYLQDITDRHPLNSEQPLKVVIDCGNGVPGPWITDLLARSGCEVIPLFCDVDGTFPNHHPNPEEPENLKQLVSTVLEQQADIGLALDGDGDRLGVVTQSGTIITADQLICLFADRLLDQIPEAEIVHDVKSSLSLRQLIQSRGGKATMWKCGHSMIKNRMRETGAPLGGEFSGHLFFADRWFGFDDGLYSAIRLLSELAVSNQNSDQLFAAYPPPLATPMINIQIAEQEKFGLIEKLTEQSYPDGTLYTIDGLRVEYQDGWFGIRASNTTPVLTVRIEADNPDALLRIQRILTNTLKLVDPGLQIPELAVTNDTNIINRDN